MTQNRKRQISKWCATLTQCFKPFWLSNTVFLKSIALKVVARHCSRQTWTTSYWTDRHISAPLTTEANSHSSAFSVCLYSEHTATLTACFFEKSSRRMTPQYFSDSVNGSFLQRLLLCCTESSSRSFFGRFTVLLSRRVAMDAGVAMAVVADSNMVRYDGVTGDTVGLTVDVVSAFRFTPFFIWTHNIQHQLKLVSRHLPVTNDQHVSAIVSSARHNQLTTDCSVISRKLSANCHLSCSASEQIVYKPQPTPHRLCRRRNLNCSRKCEIQLYVIGVITRLSHQQHRTLIKIATSNTQQIPTLFQPKNSQTFPT